MEDLESLKVFSRKNWVIEKVSNLILPPMDNKVYLAKSKKVGNTGPMPPNFPGNFIQALWQATESVEHAKMLQSICWKSSNFLAKDKTSVGQT